MRAFCAHVHLDQLVILALGGGVGSVATGCPSGLPFRNDSFSVIIYFFLCGLRCRSHVMLIDEWLHLVFAHQLLWRVLEGLTSNILYVLKIHFGSNELFVSRILHGETTWIHKNRGFVSLCRLSGHFSANLGFASVLLMASFVLTL